ncbi:MAG TPA: hypothetical protein VFN67_13760 [Polyangiales bacterium]|nr:hypothetical protein [Polyangiales bacterium]
MMRALLLLATWLASVATATAQPVSEPESTPAELTDAELEQLGFNAAEPAVDYDIKLSGFIDFGGTAAVGQSQGLLSKPAFSIGNLNLYVSKNLSESVRTMVEVRFLYLPNGAPTSLMDRSYISTAVPDYNDFQRELRWGGVEIERVYVEWAVHRLLTIRLGQFLTPYGVWNVDHGTPTIIPIQRPFVIGYSFFPERQTGIELHGRWGITNNGTLGYHLTLSNGTGPISEYADLDKNKAVGGRLYWEYRKWGELKLGGSFYYGRYTSSSPLAMITDGTLKTSDKLLSQWDSLAFAVDAVFKYQGAVVQAEFAVQQLAFTPEGRTARFSLSTSKNSYPADGVPYGGYLLLGYRFDWFGVMPYVVFQRVGGADPSFQSRDESTPFVIGVNVRPIESLVAKLEYQRVFFDSAQSFPGYDIQLVAAQVAWAF